MLEKILQNAEASCYMSMIERIPKQTYNNVAMSDENVPNTNSSENDTQQETVDKPIPRNALESRSGIANKILDKSCVTKS